MEPELSIFRCLTVAFCVLVVSTASCTAHQNYLENETIAKSSDSAATACAIASTERKNTPFCVEIAKAHKQ